MKVPEYARMYEAENAVVVCRHARSAWPCSARTCPPRPEGRWILDAGSGTGSNLRHLARFGRTIGVDLSDDALRWLAPAAASRSQGAACSPCTFPDAVFDCVTSFDVLYHQWVTDDRVAVAELVRVLRPGGVPINPGPGPQSVGRCDESSRHQYTQGWVHHCGGRAWVVQATAAARSCFPWWPRARSPAHGAPWADVGFSRALEWAFRSLLEVERGWFGSSPLPVGASVFALARCRWRRAAGPSGYNPRAWSRPRHANAATRRSAPDERRAASAWPTSCMARGPRRGAGPRAAQV